MKNLFILFVILFSITVTAQTPVGYDGGNELYNAIKKTRQGNATPKPKTKKTKSTKKKTVTVKQIKAPVRTPYEAAYYETYGTDCPSYLKKLMESEYWETQKKDALQAEIDSEKRHAEQRKLDSIEKIRIEVDKKKHLQEGTQH